VNLASATHFTRHIHTELLLRNKPDTLNAAHLLVEDGNGVPQLRLRPKLAVQVVQVTRQVALWGEEKKEGDLNEEWIVKLMIGRWVESTDGQGGTVEGAKCGKSKSRANVATAIFAEQT
jgi:hypothetical protein